MENRKRYGKNVLRAVCFMLFMVVLCGTKAEAFSRDNVPVVSAGINLNLNQTPKEFRLSKAKFSSEESRLKAVDDTLRLYESWVKSFRIFQKIGEPDYEKGEVFSTVWESEAKFELSVMGYYCGFLMSRLYREYRTYEEARASEDYYLYLQAVYCFISTNNVCFKGAVTGNPKSVKKAHFSGLPVYESFYSADYKRLDNLHGPHSQPIHWFNDREAEKTKAVWAKVCHSKGKITDDFLPKNSGTSFNIDDKLNKKIKKVSLKKIPDCMKLHNIDEDYCEMLSANYIDISDILKSQHSNFQDGLTEKDYAYTELLEAATQVFQYIGRMTKSCSRIAQYKQHRLYPYYLRALKCFISVDQKCFGGKFGKCLEIDELGFAYVNVFSKDVKTVMAKYPCKKAGRLKKCVYLKNYAV